MKNHIRNFGLVVLMAVAAMVGAMPVQAASGIDEKLFVQSGTGAVARTAAVKMGEVVSVKDFGAVGDGVTDDQPAIQKALNTGKSVLLPNGIYRVNSFLLLSTVGQRMYGESLQNVYLTTAAASTHDILRVAGSLADVSGILFRPGSASNICVRIYGASVHLHKNRFLAAVNGSGTAVILTDQDPAAGSVAGAYTHVIEDNHFGAAGHAFSHDIVDGSKLGITATKFLKNKHFSDGAIQMMKGGGNLYMGNLFQSATGTSGAKVGQGLDLGAKVYSETIIGNYFELYDKAILTRAATAKYTAFYASGNHYDNNANDHYSISSRNYQFNNQGTLSEYRNGWTDNYSSTASRSLSGVGGVALLTLDNTNAAVKTGRRYSTTTTLSYTADSQTVTPASEYVQITGSGAARIGCVLGAVGVQDGQPVILLGLSWPVTLTNSGVQFAAGATTAQFGNTTGQIQAMHLVYVAAQSKWIEVSRTVK